MSIAKRIPNEPSKQIVDTACAFNVLCGLESFEILRPTSTRSEKI